MFEYSINIKSPNDFYLTEKNYFDRYYLFQRNEKNLLNEEEKIKFTFPNNLSNNKDIYEIFFNHFEVINDLKCKFFHTFQFKNIEKFEIFYKNNSENLDSIIFKSNDPLSVKYSIFKECKNQINEIDCTYYEIESNNVDNYQSSDILINFKNLAENLL